MAESPKEKSISPLTIVGAIIAVAVAFGAVFHDRLPNPFKSMGSGFVTVDTVALVEAATRTAMERPGVTIETAQAEAAMTAQRISEAVDAYAKRGIVVLHRGAVIAMPGELDVTDKVAAEVGINLGAIRQAGR